MTTVDSGATTSTTPDHEHIWDKWFPYDRRSHHRTCVIPDCPAFEIREFSA